MEAPPNYGAAYTAEFRQVVLAIWPATHKCAFIPFFLEGVAGIPALNIADGIHPNPAGCADRRSHGLADIGRCSEAANIR